MPYNTNWKDGNYVMDRPKSKETPDPLKKRVLDMVNNNTWCQVCNFPHSPDLCIVAQSIQEEEIRIDNNEEDHAIYLTSHILHPIEQGYSSLEEGGYEYNVDNQRYNVHMVEQQVFSNHEEKNDEHCSPSAQSQSGKCNVRRPTKEEIEKLTITVVTCKNKIFVEKQNSK